MAELEIWLYFAKVDVKVRVRGRYDYLRRIKETEDVFTQGRK